MEVTTAYFAFNQASAWADPFLWAPLQIAGSIGMLLGERRGFLLALMASVPFWCTAVFFFIWDRDLGYRRNTLSYRVITWPMWPLSPCRVALINTVDLALLDDEPFEHRGERDDPWWGDPSWSFGSGRHRTAKMRPGGL